ncbi:MAG: 30S ribosomal protein S12 methylthiotransferase RimO, partial [Oscillospiraceae bacterium]
CCAYSAEEDTPAALMSGQIDEEEKIHRAEIVTEEQMTIMVQDNEKKIGKTILVVTEGFDKFGECYFGRSEADAPDIDGKIFFSSEKKLQIGQFVQVHLEDILDLDLMGTVLPEAL